MMEPAIHTSPIVALPAVIGHNAVSVSQSGTRVMARNITGDFDVIDTYVEAGLPIAEIFFEAGLRPNLIRFYHCFLQDESGTDKCAIFIPLERWPFVKPKPGILVRFIMVPQGAGGQKGALGIALRAVVVVIAAIATWYAGGIGGPAAAGGLSLGGAAAGAAAGAAVGISGSPVIAGRIAGAKEETDR